MRKKGLFCLSGMDCGCWEWVDKVKTICNVSQILSYYSLIKDYRETFSIRLKCFNFVYNNRVSVPLKGLKLEQKEIFFSIFVLFSITNI